MEEEKRNEPETAAKKSGKRTDPVVVGLMFGVSFLCLCIIGVMIYWLAAFLH